MSYTLTESIEIIEARVEDSPRSRILKTLNTLRSNIALIQAKSSRLNTDIDLGDLNRLNPQEIARQAKSDYSEISQEMIKLQPIYTASTKKQLKKDFAQMAINVAGGKGPKIKAAAMKLSKIIGARGNSRLVANGHPTPNMFDRDTANQLLRLIDELSFIHVR